MGDKIFEGDNNNYYAVYWHEFQYNIDNGINKKVFKGLDEETKNNSKKAFNKKKKDFPACYVKVQKGYDESILKKDDEYKTMADVLKQKIGISFSHNKSTKPGQGKFW